MVNIILTHTTNLFKVCQIKAKITKFSADLMADTFLLTILQHYCITALLHYSMLFNVDINKTGYDHRNGSFI